MARQLTLFGKLSQERSVYQVPANEYEKFVNFYLAGKFVRLPIAEAKRLADGEWRCHRLVIVCSCQQKAHVKLVKIQIL